jgi:hypothetical protein
MFAAKHPGELGNSIKVSFWKSSNTTAFDSWEYSNQFNGVTGTSDYASSRGGANDEIHVIVLDANAKFSSVTNTVLEKFSYLSVARDAKNDDGSSKYYVDVINDLSEYIYVINHDFENGSFPNTSNAVITATSFEADTGGAYTADRTGIAISVDGGSGSGAQITVDTDATGNITAVNIVNSGAGYLLEDTLSANTTAIGGGAADANISFTLSINSFLSEAFYPNWGSVAEGSNFADGNNTGTIVTLGGGVSGSVNNATRITGYDKFANPEEVDVSLIITGNADSTLISSVKSLVETRKDCVAFVSPDFDDCVNKSDSEVTNIVEKRNLLGSSSYMVMDSGWKYQFDKYNNVYRWVPLNGDIAGLCVRTDFERDAWFSPAGFNRGQIRNVIKLAWYPTKSERDDLYKNNINPVVTFPGEGVILFGDKTLLAKPSAFDRINVRRLFIVLEKAIARAAKYSLFEFNDAFTRAQFVALVEPYLRDVQGRRGIFDFRVVCDETNNTPEVIDRNEFVGDIYIKPARSINFIQLNFIAVRTGVAFEEIVGRY